MPHWERFDEQQRDKAIQKLASKSAGDPGLGEGVRFIWERIVKKNYSYYNLGKEQRQSKFQNNLNGT